MICDVNMRDSYNRQMTCTMLGTFSQMTADMVKQFGSEQEFLKTHDGCFIQVFFLPAAKRFENVNILANTTMIICNPNFGYAET